jgi:hypothetical protein
MSLLFNHLSPGAAALGTTDNTILFTTPDVLGYDCFEVRSVTGVLDVEYSLDRGATWGTAPLALQPLTTTSSAGTWVLVTTADLLYKIAGGLVRVTNLRLRQASATALTAWQLLCVKSSSKYG